MDALNRERFEGPFDLTRVVAIALHRRAVVGLAHHQIVSHHAIPGRSPRGVPIGRGVADRQQQNPPTVDEHAVNLGAELR
jgi:hypothetical protein